MALEQRIDATNVVKRLKRARRLPMQATQVWFTRELRRAMAIVEDDAEASMGDVIRHALVYYMEREYPHALVAAGLPVKTTTKRKRVGIER